jgi:hypothetical protein
MFPPVLETDFWTNFQKLKTGFKQRLPGFSG